LSHRSLLKGDDEPKPLPYAKASISPMGPDVGQGPNLKLAAKTRKLEDTGRHFDGSPLKFPSEV